MLFRSSRKIRSFGNVPLKMLLISSSSRAISRRSGRTFDRAHIIPRQHSLFQNAAEYPSGEDLLTRDPCAVYGIVSICHREESKDLQELRGKQKRQGPGR